MILRLKRVLSGFVLFVLPLGLIVCSGPEASEFNFYWQAWVGIVAGFAVHIFGGYLIACLQAVGEANDWSAWLKFEPRYLTSFVLLVIGVAIGVMLNPALLEQINAMSFLVAFAYAYGGQVGARQVVKLVQAAYKVTLG